jgi:DNA repair exonuclease SbcCD nuclease subunit
VDVKVLHTADVHLGVKMHRLGPEKAELQRKQIKDTFAAIVARVISEKYQLLLIAGDLFDSNSPSYETILFVKNQLAALDAAGVYCVIAPGTHDCLSRDSIYLKEHFAAGLSHIYVFNDLSVMQYRIDELGVTVWAKANTANASEHSPIFKLPEKKKNNIDILLAHGSFQIEGKSSKNDYPITADDVLVSNMDYVALGHWHGAANYSKGNTVAWYSGSPEVVSLESKGGLGQGYVLSLSFLKGSLDDVVPVKVGKRSTREVVVEVGGMNDAAEVMAAIQRAADADVICFVTLKGIASPALFIDTEGIAQALWDSFYFLHITNETAQEASLHPELYPEQTVMNQFLSVAKKRIDSSANEEDKQIAERAVSIGMALLQKKDIL